MRSPVILMKNSSSYYYYYLLSYVVILMKKNRGYGGGVVQRWQVRCGDGYHLTKFSPHFEKFIDCTVLKLTVYIRNFISF